MNNPATQGDLQGTLMFLHNHFKSVTHPKGDKTVPKVAMIFRCGNVLLCLCNAVAITTKFGGLGSYAYTHFIGGQSLTSTDIHRVESLTG